MKVNTHTQHTHTSKQQPQGQWPYLSQRKAVHLSLVVTLFVKPLLLLMCYTDLYMYVSSTPFPHAPSSICRPVGAKIRERSALLMLKALLFYFAFTVMFSHTELVA